MDVIMIWLIHMWMSTMMCHFLTLECIPWSSFGQHCGHHSEAVAHRRSRHSHPSCTGQQQRRRGRRQTSFSDKVRVGERSLLLLRYYEQGRRRKVNDTSGADVNVSLAIVIPRIALCHVCHVFMFRSDATKDRVQTGYFLVCLSLCIHFSPRHPSHA